LATRRANARHPAFQPAAVVDKRHPIGGVIVSVRRACGRTLIENQGYFMTHPIVAVSEIASKNNHLVIRGP
ncbi:MAG: hypothetical protein OEU92_07190, partial [Alphaproteobacteria bacterium]|nr:hypothetical protein [Alphaproteobacteria bacterium]